MKIQIHSNVFEIAPDFHRGVVIAHGLNNGGDSEALQESLTEAQKEVKAFEEIASIPSIAAWDEAHRRFASNPNKFPPAHKNLLKRVHRPDVTLPFISKVVAVMNTASLRLRTPVGGDDIDRVLSFGEALDLRLADGSESFLPLGKDVKEESPEVGEIVYVVGRTVMCRRWNWRNSCQTLIGNDTKRIVMNIDCLGPDAEDVAKKGTALVGELLLRHCGATVTEHVLGAANPELAL